MALTMALYYRSNKCIYKTVIMEPLKRFTIGISCRIGVKIPSGFTVGFSCGFLVGIPCRLAFEILFGFPVGISSGSNEDFG
jgi:hypothetical protein